MLLLLLGCCSSCFFCLFEPCGVDLLVLHWLLWSDWVVVAGGVTLKLLRLFRVALARRAVVVCRLVERGWLHQTQLPPPWSAPYEGWEALPVGFRPTLPRWAHAAVAALGFGGCWSGASCTGACCWCCWCVWHACMCSVADALLQLGRASMSMLTGRHIVSARRRGC